MSDTTFDLGDVYAATGYTEQDGFHLLLLGDRGDAKLRVRSFHDAAKIVAAVTDLIEWVEVGERERAAFDAASPAERALVMGMDTAHGQDTFSRRWDLLVEQA